MKLQLGKYLIKELTNHHKQEMQEILSDRSESSEYLETETSDSNSDQSGATVSEHSSES